MKRGIGSFLQVVLPCAAVFAVLPYGDVVTFTPVAGDRAVKAPTLFLVELDEAAEAAALRRAKTGFTADDTGSDGRYGQSLKADLLMRELIADDIPRDSGIAVVIPPSSVNPVPFEPGVFTPSSAAHRPEELPVVTPFRTKRVAPFPRDELLNLPD